jgi:hypothetical protein
MVEREYVELLVVSKWHASEYFRGEPGGVERSLEWIDDDLRG